MKTKIYIICIMLLAFFTLSCSEMNDLSDQFLDEGETIYAAKIDSVTTGAGKERIQLEMFIWSQRIETIRIFWNDYADSVDVHVGNQTGAFKKMLGNMAEKGYIFQLVSLDEFGNRSLPVEVTGTVYGNIYQSGLFNRSIRGEIYLSSSTMEIQWASADITKGAVATELEYKTSGGTIQKLIIPASEEKTAINDVTGGMEYRFRTAYLPNSLAIDTFYTDYTTVKSSYPDVTNFGGLLTAQYNDSPAGQDILKLIDNDINTKYLTFHNAVWVVLQQLDPSTVSGYALTSGGDAPERDPASWTLEGSNDGNAWTLLDTRSNEDFTERLERRYFDTDNESSYSYYRLKMTNHSGGIFQLAELELYGQGGGGTPVKTIYFEESFASGIPSAWTSIDKDGDGYQWEYTSTNGGFAMSDSYRSGVGGLHPENYLASPAITIPAGVQDITLSYGISSVSVSYYQEQYRILISESPITHDNCRNAAILQDWQELTSVHSNWSVVTTTVSLQQYAGKTIYIAFLHGNTYDMYSLVLKDITVYGYTE